MESRRAVSAPYASNPGPSARAPYSSSSSHEHVELEGLRSSVLQFGQTPTQLFRSKPHPPRKASACVSRLGAPTFLLAIEQFRASAESLAQVLAPLSRHQTSQIVTSFFYHGSTRPYQLQPLPQYFLFIPPGAARTTSASAAAAFQSAAPSSSVSATSTSAAASSAKLVFWFVFLFLSFFFFCSLRDLNLPCVCFFYFSFTQLLPVGWLSAGAGL